MSSATLSTTRPGRLRTYASFVRLEHTLFSLPLLLAGVFSVPGPAVSAGRWGWIALAAVGARTAAMAMNRLIDRRLDAQNPRTRTRELPSGAMSIAEAGALLVGSVTAYLVACAALGPWFLEVSPIPLAVFAGYPYLKRVTPFCHFGVGLALALAPLAGYAATHPGLEHPAAALWLAGFAFVWVSGFDIIYATLDEESDRALGIHSMVAWLGRERALVVSRVLHDLASLLLLLGALQVLRDGGIASLRWDVVPTFLGWAFVRILLTMEQRWAENVNLAFFKVNVWVGVGVLATIAIARLTAAGI
jgi:4-hydroxybenzoate polyprenyltransferase